MKEAIQIFLSCSAVLLSLVVPLFLFYISKTIYELCEHAKLCYEYWKNERDKDKPYEKIEFFDCPNPSWIKMKITTRAGKIHEQSFERKILNK